MGLTQQMVCTWTLGKDQMQTDYRVFYLFLSSFMMKDSAIKLWHCCTVAVKHSGEPLMYQHAICERDWRQSSGGSDGSHQSGLCAGGHVSEECSAGSVELHSWDRPIPISSPRHQALASIYQSQVLAQASDTQGLHLSPRPYIMSVKAVLY